MNVVGMISVLNGPDEGKTFLLKNLSVFEGGRSQGNHVLLKDETVAMSHFRICRNDTEYAIYDQGAKNGTFVNGEPFDKVVLKPGDVIQAGSVEMRFDLVDPETPGRLASCAPEIDGVSAADQRGSALADDAADDAVATIQAPAPSRAPPVPERVPAPPARTGPPMLEIVEGDDEYGRVFELVGFESFSLGRSTSCNIRLRDSKVSRVHCIVSVVGDHFIVADNDSSNGTVVNGEKIRKTVLKEGDFIRLGFTILRFTAGVTVDA